MISARSLEVTGQDDLILQRDILDQSIKAVGIQISLVISTSASKNTVNGPNQRRCGKAQEDSEENMRWGKRNTLQVKMVSKGLYQGEPASPLLIINNQ